MAKETRKQIVEQTRNEVARQYKARITELEERLKRANDGQWQFMRAYNEERQRADELQEKVNQYEDWIRRLQEFMDMPEDARKKAYKEWETNAKLNEMLTGFLGTYGTFFNF